MTRSLLIAVLVALVAACTPDVAATTTTAPPVTPTTNEPTPTTTGPVGTTTTTRPEVESVAFGAFDAIPLLDDSRPYAGPTRPTSLDGVTVAEPIAGDIDGLGPGLLDDGFVVVPGDARLFHHVYQVNEYQPFPVFVTTDSAYHTWHLVFDKVLRDTEEEHLLPALEQLVAGLVDRSRAQRDELAGTELADAADRVAQFYEAVATVLGLDVGPIGPLAEEEAALVGAASSVGASPTVGVAGCSAEMPGGCTFYELFKPRGHYTRSPDLERYFRAMSLLGQVPFPLADEPSMTLATLAVRPLLVDEDAVAGWRRVYEPTAFLVGAADDYTPFELAAVADGVAPGWSADPTLVVDSDLAGGLAALRPVRINPEGASVRVMGVRLTLDSYIIDRLVEPELPGRSVASARDVAAAFGSDFALQTMLDDGYAAYPGYEERLAELAAEVSGREITDWSRTVYDAWLYAIAPMWAPHGVAFPDFMQADAWAIKAHQTGFGSYTELKRDTILYTKQAMAEGGDGGEPPPPPRHWVEPDPVPFARLAAVADLLHTGLEARGLVGPENAATLTEFVSMMGTLGRLAGDELAARPISADDNATLQSYGHWLESMWLATSDLLQAGEDGGPDEDAAVVADIMRSSTEGALEIGTGKVDRIFVLVPDDSGTFQVAVGGVYSFYEFWQDPANRLTDEEWRAMLDAGTAPDRPAWVKPILDR